MFCIDTSYQKGHPSRPRIGIRSLTPGVKLPDVLWEDLLSSGIQSRDGRMSAL